METATLYTLAGAGLFIIGLHGAITYKHLLRKILALNIMGISVFLVLIAMASRSSIPDPVPHAMVLTGIVVAVSATALALMLAVQVRESTGKCELPVNDDGDRKHD